MHSRASRVNRFNRADLRHPHPAAYTDAAMRIFAQHNGLEERFCFLLEHDAKELLGAAHEGMSVPPSGREHRAPTRHTLKETPGWISG